VVNPGNNSEYYKAALDDLLRGSADLSLSSLIMNSARLQHYSASLPSDFLKQSVLIKKNMLISNAGTLKNRLFLGVFTPQVWIVSGTLTFLLSFGIVLSGKLSSTVFFFFLLFLFFFFLQKVIANSHISEDQVAPISQALPSTITLTGVCLLWGIVLPSIFNAMIPSLLTIERPAVAPFSTIQEFLLSDFQIYSTAAVRELLLVRIGKITHTSKGDF
jgi:hypothetical protein